MRYRTIVADPPWDERGAGRSKRGADRHYPLLADSDMGYIMRTAEVWRPADDCHLWVWVTNNHLRGGLDLLAELGFRYVTNLVWVKDRYGLGRYLRGQHELCLLGTRGEAMMPDDHTNASVIHAPRGIHSAKPAEAMRLIERVSPGPRLEMFARGSREGWDVWGNEAAA